MITRQTHYDLIQNSWFLEVAETTHVKIQ